MVEITWLKSANNDLKEIYNYISKDSKRYGRLQVEKILLRTQILKTHINIGKPISEYGFKNIFELTEGNYRIIYKITDANSIEILMIHHGARDLKRRLRS